MTFQLLVRMLSLVFDSRRGLGFLLWFTPMTCCILQLNYTSLCPHLDGFSKIDYHLTKISEDLQIFEDDTKVSIILMLNQA